MELDVESDGNMHARFLQEAKWEILQGANVETDWRQLLHKHSFFSDVALEAKRQAENLASVMAATEFFLQRLLCACKHGTLSSSVYAGCVKQWCDYLAVFQSLYELSPLPTRAQWTHATRLRGVEVDIDGPTEVGCNENKTNNSIDINNSHDDDDDDDDDGLFVETRLKEMLAQCVAVGRKWCHQLCRGNTEEGENDMAPNISRAVSVINAFLAPRTLECGWKMAVAKFVDTPETAVETAIKALCMTGQHLQTIENTYVVVNRELDPTKVLLLSGGGSGHEPAAVGYVHRGFLSAAVPGGVFASPPSAHVGAAIDYLHGRQGNGGPGILVIVMNYLGDILNFQFAVQEAKERGVPIEMVLVADDVCFGADDVSRRRGIAGTIIVHKILGAAADRGESLSALKQLANRITDGLRSVGASLSSCSLPGSKTISTVPDGLVEVGLGIHGEKGLYQTPFEGAQELVAHLLSVLLGIRKTDNTHEDKKIEIDWKGAKVALLVNNLGSTTDMEMGILAYHALQQLRTFGVEVVGVCVGRYMTALEMHGFSLTILRFFNEEDISYLFYDQQPSLVPFTVPHFDPPCASGPRSALQLAKDDQCGPECNGLLGRVIQGVFHVLSDAEDYLNMLDAAVGDGDTGSGVRRAATKAMQLLPYLPLETNISRAFALLAKAVADAFGGTSGPLYGAFLLGVGVAASEAMKQDGIDSVDVIRAALRAGSADVQRLGGAKKGDRTMVDVLEALNDSPQVNNATCVSDLALACVIAAKEAALRTALLPAKCGRSRYLQGKEVGQQDPGAQLIVLWVEAAANVLLSESKQ